MRFRKGLYFSFITLVLIFSASCGTTPSTPLVDPENIEKPMEETIIPEESETAKIEKPTETPTTLTIAMGDGEHKYPDTIYFNGIVLTMEEDQPIVEAIAIQKDEIFAVGSSEGVLKLGDSDTALVDLGGRTLLPGFIDSHTHWIGDSEWTEYRYVDETIHFLLENGWTSINEMFVTPERLEKLLSLDDEGRLRVRVNAYQPLNFLDQRFGRPYLNYTPGERVSPKVRVAGVKISVDNDWGNLINWDQAELDIEVLTAHEAGWQLAVHTFSVQGSNIALKALDQVLQDGAGNKNRHRIEHVIAITDEQLIEIQKNDYIASIQLVFPGNISQADPTFYEKVPESDYPFLTRWEDIYDAGIMIVSGTDWPWLTNDSFLERNGAPAGSPLRSLYKGATHRDANDQVPEPWMSGQYLPVEAMLKSLTINGAYATFEEDVKGSLAPGKWADLVILSDDPLTVPIDELIEIDVLMTMIGGRVEYCAEDAEDLCVVQGEHADKVADTSEPSQVELPSDTLVLEVGDMIEVAVQGPVTGQLADFYPHMFNSVQLAVEDYGPLFDEHPIMLVQVDDRCDESTGADAALQLTIKHPQIAGVIGPLCSSGAMGALPVYKDAKLVTISGSVTREDITKQYGASGFNRTIPNQKQMSDMGISEDSIDGLASVQDFYTRYENKFGTLPNEIRPLMAYTYDAVHVLLSGIQETAVLGENMVLTIELLALADAVRFSQNTIGVTGAISFDENGDRIPAESMEN